MLTNMFLKLILIKIIPMTFQCYVDAQFPFSYICNDVEDRKIKGEEKIIYKHDIVIF